MTLPWKVLVLSIAVMLVVEAYQIDYLAEWFYTGWVQRGGIEWRQTGAHQRVMLVTWQWLALVGLANLLAISVHVARTRLARAAPDAKSAPAE